MNAYGRKRLYRSRRGKIFGVCKGIAQWRDLPVQYIRLAFILAAVFTAFFAVGAVYILIALFLPVEPEAYGEERSEGRPYEEPYGGSRNRMYADINRDFKDLNERVRNMEAHVYDKEKDWEERLRRG